MKRSMKLMAAAVGLGVVVAAGWEVSPSVRAARAVAAQYGAGARMAYGDSVAVGDGWARTYVVKTGKDTPVEIGVALDSAALEGLPAPDPASPAAAGHSGGAHQVEHVDSHEFLLPLPAGHGTPYRLVELDWNPAGHVPAGIYDKPHFDFHFYTITEAERNAIDPADSAFWPRAERLPAPEFIPAGYVTPQPVMAVPRMGVHWVDSAAAELPPRLEPFTGTFITGSWDGKVIFQEPMITRDFILSRPNLVVPVAQPAKFQAAGYYPGSYRVTWSEQAKEYRIALSGLSWRD